MTAYYNEIEPFAAQWLRNLISAGHIAAGDVDERSIVDVSPDDLRGYDQCHFFAGIGAWSYALRLAGWGDDRPVWTGSCPCQPFSAAGRGRGFDDDRHLWPVWFELIRECRPAVVFGEQVASPAGLGWFDVVCADLEGEVYACGAADTCAAGVGAPHIRQRLYFVADALSAGWSERRTGSGRGSSAGGGVSDGLADAGCRRVQSGGRPGEAGSSPTEGARQGDQRERLRAEPSGRGDAGRVADAAGERCREARRPDDAPRRADVPRDAQPARIVEISEHGGREGRDPSRRGPGAALPPSPWDRLEWLPCRDGKARPTQPGLFPLAHGASARVGRLRAYGNAINPYQAAAFIGAADEALVDLRLTPQDIFA